MQISAVKQQVKNPERASIFIDGKYSFSLSLSELVIEKLKPGIELDDQKLKRLKKISDDGKIKSRAMEWVLNRPRSVREFKDYMFSKKADPELTSTLISNFTSRGYLDEEKFTRWLVEFRRRGGKSERAIGAELSAKGVSREIFSKVMDEDSNEIERLDVLIKKKQKLSRYKADQNKLIQYLVRQGYSYQDVKERLTN